MLLPGLALGWNGSFSSLFIILPVLYMHTTVPVFLIKQKMSLHFCVALSESKHSSSNMNLLFIVWEVFSPKYFITVPYPASCSMSVSKRKSEGNEKIEIYIKKKIKLLFWNFTIQIHRSPTALSALFEQRRLTQRKNSWVTYTCNYILLEPKWNFSCQRVSFFILEHWLFCFLRRTLL